MNFRTITLSFAILLFAATFADAQVIPDEIGMTTPGAPWTITIEGRKLDLRDVKVKADERSAYFLMEDQTDGLNVSFYIEPVDKCKTSDECRDYVLGLGNPAWGKYQDLAKGKIAGFSYFEFFRPEVQGRALKLLDMYAQFVEKGYWIDLHISKVLYKKEEHDLFENLIKGIRFVPKNGKPTAEPVRERIATTTNSWLQLWDTIKCKETYAALTSLSKEAVTEQQWTPYCQNIHQSLGKLQSRKLIASSLIKSLPFKPELSGAQFRYRSVFQNTTGVEIVTLTQAKDGTWTVSNYLMR